MSDLVAERSEHPEDLDIHFHRLVTELTQEFAGVHDQASIEVVVSDVRSELEASAKVTSFLPVLASKHARRRLKDSRGAVS